MQEAVSILRLFTDVVSYSLTRLANQSTRRDATYDAMEIMARCFTPLLTTTNEMENIKRYVLNPRNDIYPFEIEMVFLQRLLTELY